MQQFYEKLEFCRGPFLYYVSKGTGWVGSEKWKFSPTFSAIYADEGWVGGTKKVQNCADVISIRMVQIFEKASKF